MGLLNALRRLGYTKEQMTIHGFRAMASTLLNEQGYRPDVIEAQLAHGDQDAIRSRKLYLICGGFCTFIRRNAYFNAAGSVPEPLS
jgi:hypothetical protein